MKCVPKQDGRGDAGEEALTMLGLTGNKAARAYGRQLPPHEAFKLVLTSKLSNVGSKLSNVGH